MNSVDADPCKANQELSGSNERRHVVVFLPECTKLLATRFPLRAGSGIYPTGAQLTVRVWRVIVTGEGVVVDPLPEEALVKGLLAVIVLLGSKVSLVFF